MTERAVVKVVVPRPSERREKFEMDTYDPDSIEYVPDVRLRKPDKIKAHYQGP